MAHITQTNTLAMTYNHHVGQLSLRQSNKRIDTLKNAFEFEIVFRNGMRFSRDFMVIYAISLRDFLSHLRKKRQYYRRIETHLLLGFSINKKVANACKRNLVKRRIRSVMYNMTQLSNKYVFVFVCRKGIAEYDYSLLSEHILYSIKRLTQQKEAKNNTTAHTRQNRPTLRRV